MIGSLLRNSTSVYVALLMNKRYRKDMIHDQSRTQTVLGLDLNNSITRRIRLIQNVFAIVLLCRLLHLRETMFYLSPEINNLKPAQSGLQDFA